MTLFMGQNGNKDKNKDIDKLFSDIEFLKKELESMKESIKEIELIKNDIANINIVIGMSGGMKDALDYMNSSQDRMIYKDDILYRFRTLRQYSRFNQFKTLLDKKWVYFNRHGRAKAVFVRYNQESHTAKILWDKTKAGNPIKVNSLGDPLFENAVIECLKMVYKKSGQFYGKTIIKGKYKPGSYTEWEHD